MSQTPRSRPLLIGGVVFAVVVILAASAALWTWIGGNRPNRTDTQHVEYTRPASRVELDMEATDVRVVAGEPGKVSVTRQLEWSPGNKPTVTERWSGGVLRIVSRCPDSDAFLRPDDCELRYTVRVPPEVLLAVDVGAGSVSVRGVRGDVRVFTSAGDVRVVDVAGDVTARSDSGSITATRLRSSLVDMESDAGDVSADFAQPPNDVRLHTDAGDVAVTVPRTGEDVGYRVQAETRAGERMVDVWQDSDAKRFIRADTDAGDLRVAYAR